MQSPYKIPEDEVHPIEVFGLKGRALEIESKGTGKTPILFVYGVHTLLERVYTVSQVLAEFGPVTAPDLPGFGGMMSLEHVKERPSINNLADYLAAFIEQRFPDENQQVIMVGFSLGFVLLTRMLQRHPHLTKRVRVLVSLAGFVSAQDLKFNRPTRFLLRSFARVFRRRPWNVAFRYIYLQPPVLTPIYAVQAKRHPKFKDLSRPERAKMIKFEVYLWQSNDVRTYFWMLYQISNLDLTRTKVKLPVHQISIKHDQYFKNKIVRQNMRKIFEEVTVHYAELPNHAPTIIEDVEGAAQILPETMREVLRTAGV